MDVITLHTNQLYKQIRQAIRDSTTVYILSSFIMKSGVDIIFNELQIALNNGADVKILTGDYLHVTQPHALAKLLTLAGDNLEIRLWQSDGVSFHPKSFIFKHEEHGSIVVGSSNLSRSALTSGIEWNLQINRKVLRSTFEEAMHQFIALFYGEQTVALNHETIKQYDERYHAFHRNNADLLQTWTKSEEIELTLPTEEDEKVPIEAKETASYTIEITPRLAQLEALTGLEATLAEQYSKAMVVMATGLGKTYLAAFFAKKFKKVLFIAHREEILKQARDSFEKVLQIKGGLYYGLEKEKHDSLIFASIYTLSIQDHLQQFEKDEFDLVIIDEFHHAAAKTYGRIIEYFEPAFLLGLTATPERTDGKDVFAICDGNVAYDISFIEAIQKGWLTPFAYYGIKDDIDYSQIRWLGKKYDEQQLLIEQVNEQRANYIYEKWNTYKQTRTIAFCSSIKQAIFLTNHFIKQGINAISLTSAPGNIPRADAIEKLATKEIEIIFTVDLFNEGVDIPSVDTLLFVRPTESLVVFTQQIGRGLRKYANKDQCVIIDLIGNYRHADTKFQVFSDRIAETPAKGILPTLPDNCEIHLDTGVIDLLEELRKKRSSRKERIYADYIQVKERLGRRPTYREVHLYGLEFSREYRQAFGGYFAFLNEFEELTAAEKPIYNTYYNWFNKLEKEQMTKSYKMVVLEYLLQKGPRDWYEPVTPNEVAPYFHHFYMSKEYRKQADFSNQNTKRLWEYNEDKTASLIAKMPMSKWVGKDQLIFFDGKNFGVNFEINKPDESLLHMITRQICEYKMQVYFERKGVR